MPNDSIIEDIKTVLAFGRLDQRSHADFERFRERCKSIQQTILEGYPLADDDLLTLSVQDRKDLLQGFLNYAGIRYLSAQMITLIESGCQGADAEVRGQKIMEQILSMSGLETTLPKTGPEMEAGR